MDFFSSMFAIIGVVIAIINYEIDIANHEMEFDLDKVISENQDAMDLPRFQDPWT